MPQQHTRDTFSPQIRASNSTSIKRITIRIKHNSNHDFFPLTFCVLPNLLISHTILSAIACSKICFKMNRAQNSFKSHMYPPHIIIWTVYGTRGSFSSQKANIYSNRDWSKTGWRRTWIDVPAVSRIETRQIQINKSTHFTARSLARSMSFCGDDNKTEYIYILEYWI